MINKEIISNIIEFIIVMILAFSLFIYSSSSTFFGSTSEFTHQIITSVDLYFLVIYELIILSVLFFFLKSRNWKIKDLNLNFRFYMIFIAFALASIRLIIGISITNLFNLNTIEPNIEFETSIVSILLVVIVNSIYEEVLLIGYLFKRLEKFNPYIIMLLSLMIRFSFHTYQGIGNIFMIASLGLVFGIYYIKYRKLLPLVLAHGAGNIFFFLNYNYCFIDT